MTDQKHSANQGAEDSRSNEARLRKLVDILQYQAESTQDFLDYALDQAIQLSGSKIGIWGRRSGSVGL